MRHIRCYRLVFALLMSPWLAAETHAQSTKPVEATTPKFLPPYFAPLLRVDGPMQLAAQDEKGKLSRYSYDADDHSLKVEIGSYTCERPECSTVLSQTFQFYNQQATAQAGSFHFISPFEVFVEWKVDTATTATFAFVLPKSLLFWTYQVRPNKSLELDERFSAITELVNRQRYEEAKGDNVASGLWHRQMHKHALDLLRQGKRDDAVAVLRNVVVTAPTDFEAQLDFAENSKDANAVSSSARVVLDNAEDQKLIHRATRLLNAADPTESSLPLLSPAKSGLQLILVPLGPCNIRLLQEAAAIYRKITNVPVTIMRMSEPWAFGTPDRVADERNLRQIIIEAEGPGVDFAGWTVDRYKAALRDLAAKRDASTSYALRAVADSLSIKPGQYRVDSYLVHLLDLLAVHRAPNPKTMYVGVTEANIFSGDTNYLFSAYNARGRGGASILSYAMMMAEKAGDPSQSRKRLAERVAKELVPASLKSLDIPRPVDPRDPYSYSDGVVRLDQKGLVLSAQTKQALDKFRQPANPTR